MADVMAESPLLTFKDAHGRRYRCRLVLAEGARPPVRVTTHARCCWPCFTLDVPGTDSFVASASDIAALRTAVVAHGCSLPGPAAGCRDALALQRFINVCLSLPEARQPVEEWLSRRAGATHTDAQSRSTRPLGPSGRPLLLLGGIAHATAAGGTAAGGSGGCEEEEAAAEEEEDGVGSGGAQVVEAVVLLHSPEGPLQQGVAYVRWPSDAGWTYPGEADRPEQAAEGATLRWRGRSLRLRLARCYQEVWRKPKPRRCRARVLQPGCVLLKNAMDAVAQQELIDESRAVGGGDAGFFTPKFGGGDSGAAERSMRLRMYCLGHHWHHQTGEYTARRTNIDGAAVPAVPAHLVALAAAAVTRAALAEAALRRRRGDVAGGEFEGDGEGDGDEGDGDGDEGDGDEGGGDEGGGSGGGSDCADLDESFVPDVVIINEYGKAGSLGLHQDKDESHASLVAGTPVVSVSLGAACDFVLGPPESVVGGPPPPLARCQFVRLYSGDLVVFGGASRLMWHGVKSVLAGSAPKYLRIPERGFRLNLTFRRY